MACWCCIETNKSKFTYLYQYTEDFQYCLSCFIDNASQIIIIREVKLLTLQQYIYLTELARMIAGTVQTRVGKKHIPHTMAVTMLRTKVASVPPIGALE